MAYSRRNFLFICKVRILLYDVGFTLLHALQNSLAPVMSKLCLPTRLNNYSSGRWGIFVNSILFVCFVMF